MTDENAELDSDHLDQSTAPAFYEQWDDKGPVVSGYRITILSTKTTYSVGEVVRVAHVCESVERDAQLFVMGPKPVLGEYVDGRLATDAPAADEDPLHPSSYDGRVLAGPGIDTNYEIAHYRFEVPGHHTIQWRASPYVSNTLDLDVRESLPGA